MVAMPAVLIEAPCAVLALAIIATVVRPEAAPAVVAVLRALGESLASLLPWGRRDGGDHR